MMTIPAYAKVNLTLAVCGVRPDGYHDLRSVVAPISLCDMVGLEPADEIIDASGIDFGAENLAVKAARIMRREAGTTLGARIHLEKRIPSGAGLGGGSADAAAVMRGLNALWNLNWCKERLVDLAADVGSDVPALVHGGIVLMEGRGERVRPWTEGAEDRRPLVLLKPDVHASTPAVYKEFREEDCGRGLNDLQPAACRLHPEIAEALERLKEAGACDVRMTGSGAVVFGRAADSEDGKRIMERIGDFGWAAYAHIAAQEGDAAR